MTKGIAPSSHTESRRPRFGKDHLNLADWPISVATYQQPRKKDGGKVDYIEYVIQRSDGTVQSVSLEASSKTGLPTASDEDVVIALLALAKEQGFESDVVRFVPARVLRIMDWPINQNSYRRLAAALKRLRAVTVTYKLAWYSRKSASVEPILITGILAEAKLLLRRGRRPLNALPDSYIQWTRNFYNSLRDGNLNDLDLDLYFSWRRPVAKHLHRHLNKVWHGGRKPKPYERDLRDLACGHLGMTENKDLKRNFHEVVKELEQRRYLAPMDQTVRYRKVRPGVWRVRLELHPDRTRGAARRGGESPKESIPSASDDASALVRHYHRQRFGRQSYTPKPHELRHAETLLAASDPHQLQKLVPRVVETVHKQFRGEDCHFGAAVPYFEQALKEQEAKSRSLARQSATDQQRTRTQTALRRERARQREAREQRLARWNQLSQAHKLRYYDRAIAQASSGAARSRLRRLRDLHNPPTDVLALLDVAPQER